MSTVNVGNLPVIDELFEEDMVLVQAKDRTGLLKFSDFVLGEQQVSFYGEIVNARNSINTLSTTIDSNTQLITDNAAQIAELKETTTGHAEILSSTEIVVSELLNQYSKLQDDVTQLDQSVQDQAASTLAAVNKLDDATTSIVNVTAEVNELEEAVQSLTTAVNSLNTSITTINQKLEDLETRVEALETS